MDPFNNPYNPPHLSPAPNAPPAPDAPTNICPPLPYPPTHNTAGITPCNSYPATNTTPCPPSCSSSYPSTQPHIYPPSYLSSYPSTQLPIYPPSYPSTQPPIYPPSYPSAFPSAFPSTQPPIYPPSYPPTQLPYVPLPQYDSQPTLLYQETPLSSPREHSPILNPNDPQSYPTKLSIDPNNPALDPTHPSYPCPPINSLCPTNPYSLSHDTPINQQPYATQPYPGHVHEPQIADVYPTDATPSPSKTLYPSIPIEATTPYFSEAKSESPPSSTVPSDSLPRITPLPTGVTLLYESTKLAHVFFVQETKQVVSPKASRNLLVYKLNSPSAGKTTPYYSNAGDIDGASIMVIMEEQWRLGLGKERSQLVEGCEGEIAFKDTSTNPNRSVVLHLDRKTTKEERQRLLVLLNASSCLMQEPASTVDKMEHGLENVYSNTKDYVNTKIKDAIPSVHKGTKWLRQGTGSILRFGGSMVSKGVHLMSDQVLEKETQQGWTHDHQVLVEALNAVRDAINNELLDYIQSIEETY